MFGAFRPSAQALGGLLWKTPWRLSSSRKARVRERLRNVDELIAAVARSQGVSHAAVRDAHAKALAQAAAPAPAPLPAASAAASASASASASAHTAHASPSAAARAALAGASASRSSSSSPSSASASLLAGPSTTLPASSLAAASPRGGASVLLQRALLLPTAAEMPPRDKYTTYSMRARGYRKGVHKVPKWTRLTLRENPRGF